MTTDFEILIHRNSDCVHLKLSGYFDGNAARRLLNVLNTHCRNTLTIFIHTNALNQVIPGELGGFRQHLQRLKDDSVHVVFTGEKASEFST